MGWAEGLDPSMDPEADTLRKAGYQIGNPDEAAYPTDSGDDSSEEPPSGSDSDLS